MKFSASEKYRKYLIELQFKNLNVCTVWGTDMEDGEDKLLVINQKLVAWKQSNNIKSILQKLESPFFDKENFMFWINEENLNDIYNVNDLKLLIDLNVSLLSDKSTSLKILNGINLIQDFALQVNHLELLAIFDQSTMVDLKDYVYDSHFWKGGDKNTFTLKKHEKKFKHLCNLLYTEFYASLSCI